MLKSVLAAMPTYTMTCFKLPASMYKRIQSALTRYWWDGSQNNKKNVLDFMEEDGEIKKRWRIGIQRLTKLQ